MIIHVRRSAAVGKGQRRSRIEAAIKTRGAGVYAGFLLPHVRPDMVVLDCGCGEATITTGLAEAVPAGRVVGGDLWGRAITSKNNPHTIIWRVKPAMPRPHGR